MKKRTENLPICIHTAHLKKTIIDGPVVIDLLLGSEVQGLHSKPALRHRVLLVLTNSWFSVSAAMVTYSVVPVS